jgi:hypothetical protein
MAIARSGLDVDRVNVRESLFAAAFDGLLPQKQTSVWIRRDGGLTPRLIMLLDRERAAMYPRCR